MKKLIPLALAFPLMACATTGTSSVVVQIQNATIAACGYLPDATAVATLLANTLGGGLIVGQIATIAQEICAAAVATNPPPPVPTPKSLRFRLRATAPVVVNGVTITGHFVR